MNSILPDLSKVLPDINTALDPYHPSNLPPIPKPKKLSVLPVYLGLNYKQILEDLSFRNPKLLTEEEKEALVKDKFTLQQELDILHKTL